MQQILWQRTNFAVWDQSMLVNYLGSGIGDAVKHVVRMVHAQVVYEAEPIEKLDYRASKFYEKPTTLEAITVTWEEVEILFSQLLKEHGRSINMSNLNND
ncbi:hypothetical protein H2248_010038 [Termitomyces sp. 'cryptogamus']|nr:hypothetical protein H2248_010038 [Termitomyces sp. 'cryptogamus']